MVKVNQEKLTILRCKQVVAKTGLSRSTIYLRIKEGKFPKPVSLGYRSVGWIESEIEGWLSGRKSLRDNH